MRSSHSGSRAFVLILSSLDFINIQRSPFQGHFGRGLLSSLILPGFTTDVQGQSNSLWEDLLSLGVASIHFPSASSVFGPLSFIKY